MSLPSSAAAASPASAFPPPPLRAIAHEVSALLRSRRETIAVAETAAGGLISAALLSTPGASAFYRGGVTLYSLPSRIQFADWTPDRVSSYAGPTPEVAAELAGSVRRKLGATYGVAENGTAGPTRSGEGRNRQP